MYENFKKIGLIIEKIGIMDTENDGMKYEHIYFDLISKYSRYNIAKIIDLIDCNFASGYIFHSLNLSIKKGDLEYCKKLYNKSDIFDFFLVIKACFRNDNSFSSKFACATKDFVISKEFFNAVLIYTKAALYSILKALKKKKELKKNYDLLFNILNDNFETFFDKNCEEADEFYKSEIALELKEKQIKGLKEAGLLK